MHYDLLIIGSDSEAFATASSAAQNGYHTALVEPMSPEHIEVTGRLLREAALGVIASGSISMSALRNEIAVLVQHRRDSKLAELNRLGVDVVAGNARFVNATTMEVHGNVVLTADSIVLACGTKAARCRNLPANGPSVVDVESLLLRESLPQSTLIVGAGRTGLDYASALAVLGIDVTVIDEHSSPKELYGNVMGLSRLFEAQSFGIAFRTGDEVIGIQTRPNGHAAAHLASGKVLTAEVAMICVGRDGRTDELNLEAAGVGLDEHGRVWCDAEGRTWAPTIRAVGDVVGYRANRALAG